MGKFTVAITFGICGVILTGANEDGAAGLAAVQDGGGMTGVQQPETARSPQMILSALKLRPADLVLPLGGIAALFESLVPEGVPS